MLVQFVCSHCATKKKELQRGVHEQEHSHTVKVACVHNRGQRGGKKQTNIFFTFQPDLLTMLIAYQAAVQHFSHSSSTSNP